MGGNKWKLLTSKPEELKREVMKWALENNINISAMQSSESQSLEDVFRNLTQKKS